MVTTEVRGLGSHTVGSNYRGKRPGGHTLRVVTKEVRDLGRGHTLRVVTKEVGGLGGHTLRVVTKEVRGLGVTSEVGGLGSHLR